MEFSGQFTSTGKWQSKSQGCLGLLPTFHSCISDTCSPACSTLFCWRESSKWFYLHNTQLSYQRSYLKGPNMVGKKLPCTQLIPVWLPTTLRESPWALSGVILEHRPRVSNNKYDSKTNTHKSYSSTWYIINLQLESNYEHNFPSCWLLSLHMSTGEETLDKTRWSEMWCPPKGMRLWKQEILVLQKKPQRRNH